MKRIVVVLFLFTGTILFSHAQDFCVEKLSKDTIDRHRNTNAFEADFFELKENAYHAIQSLPDGYVKDGSVDYTSYIQEALDNYKIVLMPDFPIAVSDAGLSLKSDQDLLFQKNSTLVLIPTAKSGYNILRLYNLNNVRIFYANIVGDRYQHLTNEGQWGFGISIKSSNHVSIYSPYIRETWGDGIYIGQLNNIPSEKVKIYNAVIDDVRRNGISITSAKGVDINNCFISNTNGNSPESGLDLEPNSIHDEILDINIKYLTTYNNKWSGILLVFEKFKSDLPKKVSVNIDGHIDIGSSHSISFHGYRNDIHSNNLSGRIVLNDVDYSKSKSPYFFYKTNLSNLKIETSIDGLETKFNGLRAK